MFALRKNQINQHYDNAFTYHYHNTTNRLVDFKSLFNQSFNHSIHYGTQHKKHEK